MNAEKKTLIVPVLLITVGAGRLLTMFEVVPDVDWVWTLALASVGLMTLVVNGLEKVSVVVGPFFLVASGLSVLRQMGVLPFRVEVPILLIVTGVLLCVARLPAIRMPQWLLDDSALAKRGSHG